MQGSLTACSQGQASGTASDEVVERVIRLFTDLGTNAGGEAKYGSDGGCGGRWGRIGPSLSQGSRPVPEGPTRRSPDFMQACSPAVNVYRPVLATPSRKEVGVLRATL